MYGVELYARVRRACRVDGLSHREAAREFGIDRKTVAKMLAFSVPPGYRRSGPPRRPKLDGFTGIIDRMIQSVTDEIAESLGLNEAAGALIASVSPESPADLGEIEAGDVVLSFDGQPIEEMRDLPRIVADTDIGRSVPVEVWRRGEVQVLSVEVGELDEDLPVLASATTGSE